MRSLCALRIPWRNPLQGVRVEADPPSGFKFPANILTLAESSRENADDRLSRAPLRRIEGGDRIVQTRNLADVRPQSSVPDPLNDLG